MAGYHAVLKPKLSHRFVKSSNNDLPKAALCVVCGDEASGKHYRAMTCEGCKTFFRRNVARRELLKCDLDEEKCVINPYLRRHCAFCRMKKCLESGMQVDRVWDKERIKTRKRISKKPKEKISSTDLAPATPLAVAIEDKCEEDIPQGVQGILDLVKQAFDTACDQHISSVTAKPKQHKECINHAQNGDIHSPNTGVQPAQESTDKELREKSTGSHGHQNKDTKQTTSTGCSSAKHSSFGRDSNYDDMCKERRADNMFNLDHTIQKVCKHADINGVHGNELQKDQTNPGKVSECEVADSDAIADGNLTPESEDHEKTSPKPALCQEKGTSPKGGVQSSDQQATPSSSSAQPDGALTSYILKMTLLVLRQMIAFAKALPIFSTISWEAQAALIKGAFVEYLFLGAIGRFDVEKELVNSIFFPGAVYDRVTCEKAGLGNAFNQAVWLAGKYSRLHLTPKEEPLLLALCILSPDRPGLDLAGKIAVTNTQDELADALRVSLQSRGEETKFSFPKAIMLLADLRNTTETYKNDIMKVELHANVITPLLAELFDM